MSTTTSIANFAVDANGKEVAIRYKAEDLINKCAPEGYVWQRRTDLDDKKDAFFENYDAWLANVQAAWDAEQTRLAQRTPDDIKTDALMLERYGSRRLLSNYLINEGDRPVYNIEGHWLATWFNYQDENLADPYYVAKRIAE